MKDLGCPRTKNRVFRRRLFGVWGLAMVSVLGVGCSFTQGKNFAASGTVTDETGSPIKRARVLFVDPHEPSRERVTYTNGDGDFSFKWQDRFSDPHGYILVRQQGYAYSWVAYNASIQQHVKVQIQSDDWQFEGPKPWQIPYAL